MLYSNDRRELRQLFFNTWHKHIAQQPLEPIEQQILQVMLDHPEYHALFAESDKFIDRDYLPELGETNPFLHMSLHLGIREQIATNRPAGITAIYQQLLTKHAYLEVEHLLMQVLAEQIWNAQKNNKMPEEKHYIQQLQKLLE